jgi:XRE family transcriptional regulator, regulator of sulfur utilization
MSRKKNERVHHLGRLGARIARARRQLGLSIERLAKLVGISAGNLCDIEQGKRDPRYCTLRSIAWGLDQPLATLIRNL